MPPQPDGLEKMRAQRGAHGRKKPTPRHPRDHGKPEETPISAEEAPPAEEVVPPVEPAADRPSTEPVTAQDQAPTEDHLTESELVADDQVAEKPAAAAAEPGQPAPKQATSTPPSRQAGSSARGSSRRDTDSASAGPVAAVVSLRGESERKQVEIDALSWAATARKLAEREHHLRASVEAAVAAGTPSELIVAALVQAEARGGYRMPPQVRTLAERRKSAR